MGLQRRKGCVYCEWAHARYVRGVGRHLQMRWRAEIVVGGRRHRCTSTSERNVRAWLADMLEKHPFYESGRKGGGHERQ